MLNRPPILVSLQYLMKGHTAFDLKRLFLQIISPIEELAMRILEDEEVNNLLLNLPAC